MSRAGQIGREYWFELLIAVLAVAGMLELVVGRDAPGAPATPLWFSVPAVAILVLPLLLRRRFPFAAPVVLLAHGRALTFVDGLLIPFIGSLGVVGMATAFLLGNLRDDQAGRHRPGHRARLHRGRGRQHPRSADGRRPVFIPLRFVVAWVAGYALRESAEQTQAAEMRAALAERDREAAEMRATLAERDREAAEMRAPSPSGSKRPPRVSRWPRSEPGSRASCTTSWPTP